MSKPRKLPHTKQPLVTKMQRVRTSRHGEPQVMRKRSIVTNATTGQVEVHFTLVPVTQPFERRVAAGPTIKWGAPNTCTISKKKSEAPK